LFINGFAADKKISHSLYFKKLKNLINLLLVMKLNWEKQINNVKKLMMWLFNNYLIWPINPNTQNNEKKSNYVTSGKWMHLCNIIATPGSAKFCGALCIYHASNIGNSFISQLLELELLLIQ